MKRGLLIYTDSGYEANKDFAQRFKLGGNKYGLDIDILLESKTVYGINEGNFYFNYGKPDFVINRTRNYYLAFILEQLGIRVFNNSGVTRQCNDKADAYLAAAKYKVPCLSTYISAKEYGLYAESFPAVAKQLFSHGGKKVFLCSCKKELEESALQIEGGYAITQNFLGGKEINDIRVYVLANKIIGAVKRTAHEGGFKANYCCGADIALFSPHQRLVRYINRFLKHNYYDFAGFDFLTADFANYYFNEIEDCVGSRTLCILKDIDTSSLFMQHISIALNGKPC
ncbi:MAG: hypothetical protein PHE12_01710 [Clostridia bacterium]|nr:hypothetical protein [Clostridia bacterium]